MHDIPMHDADEIDALTKVGQRAHRWGPRTRKLIKRRYNKRSRRTWRDRY
jgi:hypothetical protein